MSDPNVITLVAERIAHLHKVDISAGDGAGDYSLSTKEPRMWSLIDERMKMALEVDFDDDPYKAGCLAQLHLREKIIAEIEWLKSTLAKISSPVVFCHGDLTNSNMIVESDEDGVITKVSIIDFDYSGYDYRGFDIGTHFTKFAGITGDYSKYPNAKTQYAFLSQYLRSNHVEPTKEALDCLYEEVNAFALASYLCWGLWGILQSEKSTKSFDYLEYARVRFERYFVQKEEFVLLKAASTETMF